MKHKFEDSIDINLKVEIPVEDVENLIDKAVDGAITIIAIATVAHIIKRLV
jgi:hypothetical protein